MSKPVETILLVDDEETVRPFGARVLEKQGCRIVSGGSPNDSSRATRPRG